MKIRDRYRDLRPRRPGRLDRLEKLPEVAPDPVFSYVRDGHRWSFEEGHILVDGQDVSPVIAGEETDVSTLIGLASGLDEYKQVVRQSARAMSAGKLMALADALVEKIFGKVKQIYDDKIFGVSWKLRGNQLIVNGINLHSFLALYRVRKTKKAQQFLKGLRGKLDTLLANPSGSLRNEKARALLVGFKREIDEELQKSPPDALDDRLLHAGDPSG